jgi:hypothetical protein
MSRTITYRNYLPHFREAEVKFTDKEGRKFYYDQGLKLWVFCLPRYNRNKKTAPAVVGGDLVEDVLTEQKWRIVAMGLNDKDHLCVVNSKLVGLAELTPYNI